MPDITLCLNLDCPSRSHCYRATATPNECRQSYAGFTPKTGEDKCEMYWPTGKKEDR